MEKVRWEWKLTGGRLGFRPSTMACLSRCYQDFICCRSIWHSKPRKENPPCLSPRVENNGRAMSTPAFLHQYQGHVPDTEDIDNDDYDEKEEIQDIKEQEVCRTNHVAHYYVPNTTAEQFSSSNFDSIDTLELTNCIESEVNQRVSKLSHMRTDEHDLQVFTNPKLGECVLSTDDSSESYVTVSESHHF